MLGVPRRGVRHITADPDQHQQQLISGLVSLTLEEHCPFPRPITEVTNST